MVSRLFQILSKAVYIYGPLIPFPANKEFMNVICEETIDVARGDRDSVIRGLDSGQMTKWFCMTELYNILNP